MGSHIQLVEDGRVIGLDGRPWLPAPINAWAGFPFEVHGHMRTAEVARRYNPNPLVFLRERAVGRSRIVSERRTYDLRVAPQQVDVYPAGFRMDHGSWHCSAGTLVSIELRPSDVAALRRDDTPLTLGTTLSGTDPTLVRLIGCMRAEVELGCPGGALYAEGLSLALVAHLAVRYRAGDPADAPTPERNAALTANRQRRLVDFIDANLAGDLRIAALAAEVGLSPHHFIRVFSETFGTTPHRYVLERRVATAERLLRTDRPIAEVAFAVGFASQAHFTQAFRRRTGTTPARARDG